MLAVVFVLAAALITLLAVNAQLRSDLKHYVKLSNDNWQLYQESSAALVDAYEKFADSAEFERAAASERMRHIRAKLQPQIELMRVMLDAMAEIFPDKYYCPKCMCRWRDNHDGTMSLFDETCKSCEHCEHAPISELDPVRADGSVMSGGVELFEIDEATI